MNLLSTIGFTVGARVGDGLDKQSTIFFLSQPSFTPWLRLARHPKILGPFKRSLPTRRAYSACLLIRNPPYSTSVFSILPWSVYAVMGHGKEAQANGQGADMGADGG